MKAPSKSAKAAKAAKGGSPARRKAASALPSLRFHHSAELRRKTLSALDAFERTPDAAERRDALADVVVELTKSGLDAYFMQPLEDAKAGFLVRQSASLGLSGAQKVMGSVIRNIVGRMDAPQLVSVCGSIRQMMA